jgi:hypothetical protein
MSVFGVESVRDKNCLVSDDLALRQIPHIFKVLGTTIIAGYNQCSLALSDCQFLGLLIGHLDEC